MKYWGTILLIVFIGISSFGVFGVHAMMQNSDGGCISPSAQDPDCPNQVNSFDHLVFHLNTYQSFSFAVFGENAINTLLLIFSWLLLVCLVLFYPFIKIPSQSIISKYRYRFRNSFLSHQKQKINQWLSLLENSPAVFSRASI